VLTENLHFRDTINRMHKFLRRDLLHQIPRPHIVSFTGVPTSGKSTLIKGMDSFLRREGFRVCLPQEGAEVFRNISRKTAVYNIMTGIYALRNVVESCNTRDYDFVLLDRALYDAHAWINFWEQQGLITKEDQVLFQQFFTDDRWLKNIDLCFYVFCSLDEIMKRKEKDSPAKFFNEEESQYSNLKTLTKLTKAFKESFETMKTQGRPVISVDTTDMKKPEMFDSVFESLFQSMEKRLTVQ